MSEKYLQSFKAAILILALSITVVLASCGGDSDESPLEVGRNDLGYLKEGNVIEPAYKFKESDREIVIGMEVTNNSREKLELEAVWQYREKGKFNEILRAGQKLNPGDNVASFKLNSDKDLFRGEYNVELYNGTDLVSAHRFWVVPDEMHENDSIGVFQLSSCSPLTEASCFESTACQKYEFPLNDEDENILSVCEPIL